MNRLGFFIFVLHLTGYITVDNLSDNISSPQNEKNFSQSLKDTSSLLLLLVFIALCEQVDDLLKVECMEEIRTSLFTFASLNLCAMFVAWSQSIWRCSGLWQ